MNSSDSDKEHLDYASEIKKQFFDADKIAKELSIVTPKHSDFTYTSKFINTKKISDAIEALPSQPIDSPEVPVL
ncbi:hypothetical protein F8M41_018760 [Gigaspora margarita]|uniref:Uncharacterized protein n=1 Tax=Gigaspora margarita TaxID=4874 RepID=A0A8H4AL66_GIGMA|nr:hypothetical protein F8M41_018760 [Gigaspora margarita]